MTTLVTGAGLVGAAFARHALKRGESVVFLDPEPRAAFLDFKLGKGNYDLARKDVRDLPAIIETIRAHRVETVVHTAGLIGGRVQQALSLAFDINIGGTRNVAEAVRLGGVKRMVHVSTFGVYDTRRRATVIDEDFPRGGSRAYGAYKAANELVLEAYAAAFGFELAMLRPANVYGFGHFFAGSSGGMKMQALAAAALKGGVVRVAAADAVANEYVYADDTGRAIDLAATVPSLGSNAFNIGAGHVTSFDEVVAAAKATAPALRVDIEPGAPSSPKSAPLDLNRAREQLGWAPRFDLKAGFADFIEELRRAESVGL